MSHENVSKGWQLADVWCILMGSELSDAKQGSPAMVGLFRTWKHGSVNFLAIHNGACSVIVVDELSRNYGSWPSIERFKELQAKNDDLAKPIPGCKVELSGRVVSNEIV